MIRTYRSPALARAEADAEELVSIGRLINEGELFAMTVRETLSPDDVICVFEAAAGGVADIDVSRREDAADVAEEIEALIAAQPRGTLVLVLGANGKPWVRRSALAMLNAPGGDA